MAKRGRCVIFGGTYGTIALRAFTMPDLDRKTRSGLVVMVALQRSSGDLEVVQRGVFPVLITSRTGYGGGVLLRGDGLRGPAYRVQGEAEVGQRPSLALSVASVAEDGGGVLVGGDGLLGPAYLWWHRVSAPTRASGPRRASRRRIGQCLEEVSSQGMHRPSGLGG